MNIPVFISSLTESEKNQLRNYFKSSDRNAELETTLHFIQNNSLSTKLFNVLNKHCAEDDVFYFIQDINRVDFLRLMGAGIALWSELDILLKSKNYTVKML